MPSSFRASYKGIGELLNAEFMVADMRARAEKVAARAVETAPFDPNDRDGQHYNERFQVEAGKHGGVHKDRAYGRVSNDDKAARWVEYGMIVDGKQRVPEHATLRKALYDAAGE